MSGKDWRGKSPSVVNVTKKDNARKHFCRSLVWLVDQSVWNRQVLTVLQPIAITVAIMNHVVYVMADAAGEPLVRAKIVWIGTVFAGLNGIDVGIIWRGAVVGNG